MGYAQIVYYTPISSLFHSRDGAVVQHHTSGAPRQARIQIIIGPKLWWTALSMMSEYHHSLFTEDMLLPVFVTWYYESWFIWKAQFVQRFIQFILQVMQEVEADFTMTFRQLGELSLMQNADPMVIPGSLWALQQLKSHRMFPHWLKLYRQRLQKNGDNETDEIRKQRTKGKHSEWYWIKPFFLSLSFFFFVVLLIAGVFVKDNLTVVIYSYQLLQATCAKLNWLKLGT